MSLAQALAQGFAKSRLSSLSKKMVSCLVQVFFMCINLDFDVCVEYWVNLQNRPFFVDTHFKKHLSLPVSWFLMVAESI